MKKNDNFLYFNIFNFISTFVRALIEIFISLYLFKNGFSIKSVILFYFLANLFAIPIAYIYASIGEKTKYSYIMAVGYISFIILQLLLRNIVLSDLYILLIAIIYSLYRRGYWISRRFYISHIIPKRKSSFIYSIIMVSIQVAKILSGYIGSYLLSSADISTLIVISVILLSLSLIPLSKIKYENKPVKIELRKNLKKYRIDSLLAFSFFELDDLLSYLFPIYIALYVNNSYQLAGNLNAISNVAIIIFILIYGKIINNRKNYLILSTVLVLVCVFLKLSINSYLIVIVYFIEGLVLKMQNQSNNKIYFENNNGMDITHYSLLYQIIECLMRAVVSFLLLFIFDVRLMIVFVSLIILVLLVLYVIVTKKLIRYRLK